jgi:hypothetical protein
MGRKKTDPIERFFSKVAVTDDCWLWKANTDNNGYGLFGFDGKQWRAHRYMKHITDGLDTSKPIVMHTCDNPACVNPDHLVNGTIQENNLDKISKGRHKGWKFPNHWKKGKKKQPDGTWK